MKKLIVIILFALIPTSMSSISFKIGQATVKNQDPPLMGSKWNFDEAWLREFAYVKGNMTRLIVGVEKAKPNGCEQLRSLSVLNGGEIVDTISIDNSVIALGDVPLKAASSFANTIQVSGLAEYIEPNMKYKTMLVPNDANWTVQWGPQRIEADWAWNITTGNSSILVAVVDTGTDYYHPDLEANYAGFLVTGFVFLLFVSLGIKMKVKSDTINLWISLVLGSTLAFLGLINWVESSFYVPGLILVSMSVSFTKYKAYATYYVPTLLICGIALTILGIHLAYVTHCYLIYITGLGLLGGRAVTIITEKTREKRTKGKETWKMVKDKVLIPIILALYIGLWLFTGTATRLIIDAWKGLQTNLLFLTTPLEILLLIARATTIAVIVIKERRRTKQ